MAKKFDTAKPAGQKDFLKLSANRPGKKMSESSRQTGRAKTVPSATRDRRKKGSVRSKPEKGGASPSAV